MKTRFFTTLILGSGAPHPHHHALTRPSRQPFLAGIQRAQMIINQGVQIANELSTIATLDGQLTELTDQFQPPAGTGAWYGRGRTHTAVYRSWHQCRPLLSALVSPGSRSFQEFRGRSSIR